MEECSSDVADQGQAWPRHRECHQRAHQFDGMERENEPVVAMREVVAQEPGWAGPAPLPFDRQIVQIVIDVNHERTRKAASGELRRPCDPITSAAESHRCRELAVWSHGWLDLNGKERLGLSPKEPFTPPPALRLAQVPAGWRSGPGLRSHVYPASP